MNTGIPPVTIKPGAGASPSVNAAKPGQDSPASESVPTPNGASLPVNSNSSVSVSENGNNTKKQEAKDKPSLQEVIELSEKLNESIQKIQRDLNFHVDEDLGEIVVKVIDRSTEEVIRQIPSEEMLSLSRNIEEVNSLLFDRIKA